MLVPGSPEAVEEAREYLRVLENRKRRNPFEFFNAFRLQEAFINCTDKIKLLLGGNRCLVGSSKIYDPEMGRLRRLDEIESGFHVLARTNGKSVIAYAGKPFIKGFEPMYEVKLSNGESFICSAKHLVLTEHGYRAVSSLLPGSRLLHQDSILGASQSAHVSGDPRLNETVLDSLVNCCLSSHQCGEQPHRVVEIDPAFSPSQADAQRHTSCEASAHTDGPENRSECSRTCRSVGLQPILDGLHQTSALFFGILCRVSYRLWISVFRRAFLSALTALLSIVGFFLRRSKCGFVRQDILDDCAKPCSNTSDLVVISISYKRHDLVWDIHVPIFNNYQMAGAVHHNSGKSECGAYYIIKRCLEKPKQRWWACAETEEVSINIQQRKIWELLPKDEMRYCHYDEINGFRNGKIVFKNGSMIRFKTYKQGISAFAADDLDGIWNDEEPAYEIVKEQRMRLIDRDGEMFFTMTSLMGMTELLSELFDEYEMIESQHSDLVDEDLPRIVRKGRSTIFLLWTTENPHISQARLAEDMQVMTRQEIKSRVLGIPVNLSGRIYPMFNKKIHVVPMHLIPKRRVTLFHVLDPHDRKPWAMAWYAVDRTNTAYCIREYPWKKNFNEMEFDDKTYEDYARVINETEKQLALEYGRSVSKRFIDPNFGNKTVQLAYRQGNQAHTTPQKELRRLGFKFIDAIDALEVGHLQVRKWLHYKEKDGEIIVQPKVLIGEDCENMQRHMSKYSRKDIETADGDVKDSVKPQDRYKDFCDLKRYFLMSNPHYIERVTSTPEPTGRLY